MLNSIKFTYNSTLSTNPFTTSLNDKQCLRIFDCEQYKISCKDQPTPCYISIKYLTEIKAKEDFVVYISFTRENPLENTPNSHKYIYPK